MCNFECEEKTMKFYLYLIIFSLLFSVLNLSACSKINNSFEYSDGGVLMQKEYQLDKKLPEKTLKIEYDEESGVDLSVYFTKAFIDTRKIISESINPVKVIIELDKNKTYYLSKPIIIDSLTDVEINGNGSKIINTVRGRIFRITNSVRITLRDISIDYDPLPFTQGIIVAMNDTTSVLDVKIDKGYPMDEVLLSRMNGAGFLKVKNRETRALKEGARSFLVPSKAEKISDDTIRVSLKWPINAAGAGQVLAETGDVAVITTPGSETVIEVENSAYTSFIGVNIYSASGMGILENGGFGGTAIINCNLIPGNKPEGANEERLCSTNSDGSHFITVKYGPTIRNSKFHFTSDDAINVHSFHYFVIEKIDDTTYYVSPKWDIGLEEGDTIQALSKETFDSIGISEIKTLNKLVKPELAKEIADVWSVRHMTTQPELIYEVVFSNPVELTKGDFITSLTHAGENTIIEGNEFIDSNRVICKGANTTIENNKFAYSPYAALHVGPDIGFWAEGTYANKVRIINNTFDYCGISGNILFDGEVNGTIFISLTAPSGTSMFYDNYMNKDVVVKNNVIRNSYAYGIVVTNAQDVLIEDNIIDQVFIRNDSFNVGVNYGVVPDSGIFAAKIKNSQFSGNKVYSRTIADKAIAIVDNNSMIGSVAFDGNIFEKR